jgi:hypothetical protein
MKASGATIDRDGVAVTDVGFDEIIALGKFFGDIDQIFRVAGIGQFVHVDDAPVKIRRQQQVADKNASDESATTGNHYVFHIPS